MKTTKTLNNEAVELAGRVNTKADFEKALGVMRQLGDNAQHLKDIQALVNKNLGKLSEDCSEFLLNHTELLGDTAKYSDDGTLKSGDLTIGDEIVHYLFANSGYKREDGKVKTQAFLQALPKKWTRSKLELATEEINALLEDKKLTEEDLNQMGLYKAYKHSWSWAVTINEIDDNLQKVCRGS